MPTAMMADLHPSAYMYAYNAMVVASPTNPYLALISTISNLGRMSQSQGGLGYIPQVMPSLTNSPLQSMMQQMDESSHDMVNRLTQEIGIVFKSLMINTNHSYL